MKKLLNLIILVAFNFASGAVMGQSLGIDPIVGGGAMIALSVRFFGLQVPALFNGLNKEIWLQGIRDGFYPDSSFLNQATDFSSYVENDSINLAEIGSTPEVYKNWDFVNNGGISVMIPSDINHRHTLDRYDTQNTRIYNADRVELSYDKVLAYVDKHKKEMRSLMTKIAAFNWTPTNNSTATPILQATGPVNAYGNKSLTFEDLVNLKTKFDNLDWPIDGRVLVLSPDHYNDLVKQDIDLFKSFAALPAGTIPSIFGFTIFSSTAAPRFNANTGLKVPFGATPSATDTNSSFAFLSSEVFRCESSLEMHYMEKSSDAINRADTMGFSNRALFLPIRNIGFGAIYSGK